MQNVAILANFGNTFLFDAVNKKVQVKTGTGLDVAPDGTISATPAAATTNALSGSGVTLTSTVNGTAADLDITALVQAAETNTTLAYDAASTTITYTNENGVAQAIDLAGLASDIFISGGSFDAATQVLTLTDADGGTPDVVVDLSTLKSVGTQTSPSADLLGDGTTGNELQVVVKVSTETGNLFKQGVDGMVVLDTDIKALATVELLDLFGDPVGFIFADDGSGGTPD